MKTTTIYIVILLSVTFASYIYAHQDGFPVLTGPYLGQEPPGNTPELFAPAILDAELGYHSPVVFSSDLCEAVWSPMARSPLMMYSRINNGVWSAPQEISFGLEKGAGDGVFSCDSTRLYFLSFQPPEVGDSERERIWFVQKANDKWTDPSPIDEVVCSHPTHWTFSLASNRNLYFTSELDGVRGEQDIFVARFDGVQYQSPEGLGESINSDGKNLAPYIAPDESFLIFTRTGANTRNTDLYISYKTSTGSWTNAIEMCEPINSKDHDLCASLTPDGKYMLFLSRRGGDKRYRIYWVSSQIIKDLRPDELK